MYKYGSPVTPVSDTPAFDRTYSNGPIATRFSAGRGFAYNGRVAVALLPSLAVVAAYGGSQVAAVLVVGFMAAYILDGMRLKEGSFAAVWATMAVAYMALAYATLFLDDNDLPLSLDLAALAMCALTLLLTGIWATLQFRWVQLQHPAVAVAFEKTLIVGAVPVAGVMQAWGVAMSSGMDTAPYFLAFILCTMYALFALPLPSSFLAGGRRRAHMGGAATGPPPLQGKSDAALGCGLAVVLPAAVYAAVHSANLFQWVHLWSLLLLGSAPLLALSALPDGLWFLGKSGAADALRSLAVLVSLAGALAGVEGRIIFHSFGQYIRLAAPWSYLAITVGLYSVGALALLYLSGSLAEEAAVTLFGPVFMVAASVGGLVMGLPVWVLPAPLLAAAGLALFFESRSLRDYLLFSAGAAATGGWFLWKHFWFLRDVELDGMPLRMMCVLLGAAMVPAFIVPGLCYVGAKHTAVALPLLLQAVLLCIIEERLFAGDHTAVTYNVHPMFPAFLVMATSAAGLAMVRRLGDAGALKPVESYVLQCTYGAKLAMLVVPEARLMIPVLGLALAVSPPLLVQAPGGGGEGAEGDGGLTPSRLARSRSSLLPWQGLAMAAAVVTAVVAARYAVYDMLHLALNRRPSEALATGALLLAAALGCIPLVSRYYRSSAQAKRAVLLAAAGGALLMLLRPPLPVAGGAECPRLPFGLCPRLWNERHAPQHEEDDVSIYGDGLRRREHWPLWLLVGAAMAGLVAATSPAPSRRAAPLRLGEAAMAAVLVAGYMALEFFPEMQLLQIVVGLSALAAAAAVVMLQVPSRAAHAAVPVLLLAWAAALPAALVARALSTLPPLPPEARRLLPEVAESWELEEERMEAVTSAVLASFAAEALLLAFALKMKVAGIGSGALPATAASPAAGGGFAAAGGMAAVDKAAAFLGQCMPAYALQPGAAKAFLKGPASAAAQRLGTAGLAWAPTAANAVTLLAFALCLFLNEAFTGGAPWGWVLLSPVLLLLCQDPLLLRGLDQHRRYFPPTAAAAGLLLWGMARETLEDAFGDPFFEWWSEDGGNVARGVGLALLCLPSIGDALLFMWAQHRVSVGRAVAPAAVAALGMWLSGSEEGQLLAGVAVACGLYLLVAAQQTRRAGRKMI